MIDVAPSSTDRVLRSRRVIQTAALQGPACVVVRDGRIAAIEPWDAPLAVTDELGELALLPGLVDTHVHVNEPGRTDWEGFRSATRAALAGGITTIVDMPLNSVPATTSAVALRAKVRAMAGQLHCDVGLWGGVVPGNAEDLPALAEAGALGFKCFLAPTGVDEFAHVTEADLRVAMPAVVAAGLPLLVHAEDPERLRSLPASTRRYADWLASRPPEAEASAIRLVARLGREFGGRIHIVHVASTAAVDALDEARRRPDALALLTGETCPHYLAFAAEDIADGATAFKCAPPIRGRAEARSLARALFSGRLQLIASDHSPAPPALRDLERGDFARAWGGIASLECSLGASWSALVRGGLAIDDAGLGSLAAWMSAWPAELARLEISKGAILVGRDADLVAFDPDEEWIVDPAKLHQRHPVTPYAGGTLRGRVHATWLRGALVVRDGNVMDELRGRWLRSGGEAVDPARAFA